MSLPKLARSADLLIASLLTALAYALILPDTRPFSDEAATLMHYLELAKAGHWFTYNVGEGRLMGTGSALHTILASGLVQFLSPEYAVRALSLFGVAMFLFFTLRLLRLGYGRWYVATAGALVLLLITQNIPKTLFNGLDAPLTLGMVLAAVYFFARRSPLSYLFCALSLFTQVLTFPAVLAILGLSLVRACRDRAELAAESKYFVLYFLMPAAVGFGALSFWLGSAVPHEVLVRFFWRPLYVKSASFSLLTFPFLQPLILTPLHLITLEAAVAVATVMVASSLWRRHFSAGSVAAAIALAHVPFYLGLKTQETSPALYTVFEASLFLAVLLLPAELNRMFAGTTRRRRLSVAALGLVVTLAIAMPRRELAKLAVRNYNHWSRVAESGLLSLGLHAASEANADTLMLSPFGHTAYRFPGAVLDYSGLNSRRAVNERLDLFRLIELSRPGLIAFYGLPDLPLQKRAGLKFLACHSEPRMFSSQPYCLFRAGVLDADFTMEVFEKIPRPNTTKRTWFRYAVEPRISRFDVAIERQAMPFMVKMTARLPDQTIIRQTCGIPAIARPLRKAKVCRWNFTRNQAGFPLVWVRADRDFYPLEAFATVPRDEVDDDSIIALR